MNIPSEILLLVFLHGFKGGSDTFAQFPQRLQNGLSAVQPNVDVQAEVYPPYETRGELIAAVDKHVEWLTQLVEERKAAYAEKGGNGPVRVVLLGHSMGGLVIADSLLALLMKDVGEHLLGVVAYDTPYYGLNPGVFKNTAAKYAAYAQNGYTLLAGMGAASSMFSSFGGKKDPDAAAAASPSASSSSKKAEENKEVVPAADAPANASKWGWVPSPWVAGAAAVAAAGAAAWWQKDNISNSWQWATSHLSFVVELWKADVLERRMGEIEEVQKDGIGFHCYYTQLPKTTDHPDPSRTFIILPRTSSISPSFTPNFNKRAGDEIGAHIEMFTDKSDGLYTLGSESCSLLSGWLETARKNEQAGKKFVKREVRLV